METLKLPLIIRGETIEDYELEFTARRGELNLSTPNAKKYADKIVNSSPSSLMDIHRLTTDELLDYIHELAERLSFDKNSHFREAYRVSCITSGMGNPTLEYLYRNVGTFISRESVKTQTDRAIGLEYLNGWVTTKEAGGRKVQVRAMGARSLHIPAGNHPGVSFGTIVHNIMARSDAIIKVPSNDPLTAIAIARTMVEMAPNHPVTKHLTVGYWKGGDSSIEDIIYQPRNIEKIIAWGGFGSISHIAKYIQPGIELITLDPKLSSSIVGKEAFGSEATMREVAKRLATDMFGFNQEACLNSRVTYIQTGTDAAGIARANVFGKYLYEAMGNMPVTLSTKAKSFDPALREEIEALAMTGASLYKIYGVDALESGAVIVSQESDPVDFSANLGCRVGNLIPIDNISTAVSSITAYTQTIGIYPDSLKEQIRDESVLHGGQHIVSLGYALLQDMDDGVHDGIEPFRRMVKWVTDNTCDYEKMGIPQFAAGRTSRAD